MIDKSYTLINGDCLEVMKTLADNSVDAIVTDPPYELGFMGKSWDKSGVAYKVEVWREAFRVLKFGGHLLAFGGSRTYHRLAVAIEDAGFEIRDQIMWIYGSGFPKSLDVGKSLDKLAGVQREVLGVSNSSRPNHQKGNAGMQRLLKNENPHTDILLTTPATDEAKQWDGFGSALKPAHEPIVMARKPLEKGLSIAQNVLKHGTGAINIDGCRVESKNFEPKARLGATKLMEERNWNRQQLASERKTITEGNSLGRFPANLIHDGSDEVEAEFAKYGESKSTGGRIGNKNGAYSGIGAVGFTTDYTKGDPGFGDTGTASRFFYCAKASKSDRNEGCEDLELIHTIRYQKQGQGHLPQQTPRKEVAQHNHHPTVKPHELMKYLCRLITPPNGTILDPFCGSGSTGKAAVKEGFNFIGMDITEEYLEIAEKRIESVLNAAPLFAAA